MRKLIVKNSVTIILCLVVTMIIEQLVDYFFRKVGVDNSSVAYLGAFALSVFLFYVNEYTLVKLFIKLYFGQQKVDKFMKFFIQAVGVYIFLTGLTLITAFFNIPLQPFKLNPFFLFTIFVTIVIVIVMVMDDDYYKLKEQMDKLEAEINKPAASNPTTNS